MAKENESNDGENIRPVPSPEPKPPTPPDGKTEDNPETPMPESVYD